MKFAGISQTMLNPSTLNEKEDMEKAKKMLEKSVLIVASNCVEDVGERIFRIY